MSGISQNLRRKVKGGGGGSGEGEEAVCYVREREILLEYSRMITLLLDAGQKNIRKEDGWVIFLKLK